jgi:catechol 2,3-dioxygenase-like lactoylglutathione lyase family enzyme
VTAEHARLPAPFGRPNERDHVDHTLSGIHHVTAIGGEPQRTVDFYAGTLGLRLVKLTVNFDDPGTYHLYFGDELGRPGTILTFFPSPGSPRGHRGAGQATTVAFSVPAGSLGFWADRLTARSVAAEPPRPRLDEEVIVLHDPDGLQLELVADPGGDTREPCEGGPVPPEHAILGLFGVTVGSGLRPAAGRAAPWTCSRCPPSPGAGWQLGRSTTSPGEPRTTASRQRGGST